MRIAVYTLTRERLDYTRVAFQSLADNAGYDYDHFVVDNGSQDGTRDWLLSAYDATKIIISDHNLGISRASNIAIETIVSRGGYDLIIKLDNDCRVVTPNILARFVELYGSDREAAAYVLSPRVEGLNKQPKRHAHIYLAGQQIGLTPIVGGIFHVVPADIYRQYRYPDDLPLARGQDDHFCEWLRGHEYRKGYVEDLVVEHYETTDGQARRYPDYFVRKWQEEKQTYAKGSAVPEVTR